MDLAQISPKSAIIEAWQEVEAAVDGVIGVKPGSPPNVTKTALTHG